VEGLSLLVTATYMERREKKRSLAPKFFS
jgi:hypothetical protein